MYQVTYINGKGKTITKQYKNANSASLAVAKLQIVGIKASYSPVM